MTRYKNGMNIFNNLEIKKRPDVRIPTSGRIYYFTSGIPCKESKASTA